MKPLTLIASLALLFSCHQSANDQNALATPDVVVGTSDYKPNEKFKRGVRTVEMSLGEEVAPDRAALKKNLYGKFFNDRAEYYIVENPRNTLMESPIHRATLYYFDGKLYRVKYLVAEDKASQLMRSRPRFSIRALTQMGKQALATEPAVTQSSDGTIRVNPLVDDYELIWKDQDMIVKWRRVKAEKNYEYSEYNTAYVTKYRELQRDEYLTSQQLGTYSSW
jgi:hypothetical protein